MVSQLIFPVFSWFFTVQFLEFLLFFVVFKTMSIMAHFFMKTNVKIKRNSCLFSDFLEFNSRNSFPFLWSSKRNNFNHCTIFIKKWTLPKFFQLYLNFDKINLIQNSSWFCSDFRCIKFGCNQNKFVIKLKAITWVFYKHGHHR